jgi:hypothetical protein
MLRRFEVLTAVSTKMAVFMDCVDLQQVFATRGPPMCFVRSVYDFYNTVSIYMMEDSYLISKNTFHYRRQPVAVSKF